MSDTWQASDCPVCGSGDIDAFIEIFQVPVHCNLLWRTREQAVRAPRGDIRLGFCGDCGHIFNMAFDPGLLEYTQAYENSLHFSPRFQSYAEALAAQLVERYDLHDKDIIEIGCGQGDFLRLLCKFGDNRGVGFDPSYAPDQEVGETTEQVAFVQDFYSPRYAGYQANLICCRHVLEHIQFPRDFLTTVRRSIGERLGTVLFFEVPNVMFTLRDLGIWDLIYEHCSYFSASSLLHLFSSGGFKACGLSEAYGAQFLCIEALPGEELTSSPPNAGHNLETMTSLVVAFADQYWRKVVGWRENLERMANACRRVMVWGAGSKGVSFLNTLRTRDKIAYVVDINPRKQGMYIAGSGQKIVSPDFLRDYQPDVVIVMNPIYASEIRQLSGELGLTPELICA